MIQITDKHNCCGCSACVNACPKACITMLADEEGFLYPNVDSTSCIDCNLCEKVCPFIFASEPKNPISTYAAINPSDKERSQSSSGGIFTMLMRETLKKRGVVIGAAFDKEWNVRHKAIEKMEDIHLLQGSKYVQSYIGESYKEAKQFLISGRTVLFSGTTCQIAGLKQYLRKDYDNLITIDVVCHGVPSPRVWKDYISTLQRPKASSSENNAALSSQNDVSTIEGISFRDKLNGWRKYDFVVHYSSVQREKEKFDSLSANAPQDFRESLDKNIFIQGFLRNLYLRPSCYQCKVRSGRCGSDLTLGDFWGIWNIMPDIDDNKGVSMVLVNTKKGETLINIIEPKLYEASYKDAVKFNPCIEHSVAETKWRTMFWNNYKDQFVVESIERVINRMNPSLFKRSISKAKGVLKRLL